MYSLNGHHHLSVVVRDAERGGRLTYLLMVDGQPFWPLWRYLHQRNLDLSTEKEYALSIGMLIDFMSAKGDEFRDPMRRSEVFNAFSHAVLNGTIESGADASGLWWHARSGERSRKIATRVCDFSDWLVEVFDATQINGFRMPASAERIVASRRWSHVKAGSLLGHLKEAPIRLASRKTAIPAKAFASTGRPPAFPDQRFDQLLFEGFALRAGQHSQAFLQARPWLRWNLRDILVTLLLNGGGLRISEPFHLFVDDVSVDSKDPSVARVRVFHPHDGLVEYVDPVTKSVCHMRRADYLRSVYGRLPLTELSGRRQAGWKDSMLTDHARACFEVFWFPREYGRLFLSLYRLYLRYVRPLSPGHPFLFVTEAAQPLSPASFGRIHDIAVRRIGLDVYKGNGTTPHGHRHAYGQRLEQAGLERKLIQVAMHHRNPMSQDIYTEPDANRVAAAMEAATARMPALKLEAHLLGSIA